MDKALKEQIMKDFSRKIDMVYNQGVIDGLKKANEILKKEAKEEENEK